MKKTLYIAYGSNLNLEQMGVRCPSAKVVGATELKNYRLLFRGAHSGAVATVEPYEGGSVPVLVWEITPSDEAALDRYEGWPFLYRKEKAKVSLNGKTVSAMVYIMNEGRPLGTPSCYYYSVILEGYKAAKFDVDILRGAVSNSRGERMNDTVIEQIHAIRKAGETNMFDVRRVKDIARREGYYELVEFIEEDTDAYAKFILTGDK